MIWKRIKIVFGWLLMILAGIGVLSIATHFVVPGVSGPCISSGSSPWCEHGFTIDCSTWRGTLTHLGIELCVFAWGWGIIHNIRKENSQPIGAR